MGFSSVIKWHYLHKPFSFLVVLLWVLKAVVLAVDSDKSVLLEFKSSLSDPLGLLSSWNSESPDHCSWNGVLCDSNSRVLALNISGSRTEGNSSPYACYFLARFPLSGFGIRRNCAGIGGRLAGKLLPNIAKLSELRVLSLPNNELGGEIPRAILQMEKLEVLDIEGNLLSGSLPTSFSGLRKLRVLNLGFNRIEGGLPASLVNCVCLEILNLAGNKFNGTIPKFIGKLKELKGVYLSFNQLDGLVPSEIGNGCEKLEHLDLSANSFLGEIPSSFGNCVQLKTLLLYSNMFLEGIPADFGRLKMLQVLDVSRNSLSGPIPLELGNCSELSVLVFSNLFDPLPSDHLREGDSSLSPMNRAGGEYNYFEGEIPSQITALPKLRILWAPRTNLEGSLPSNWASCNTLEMINLAQNLLSGKIPEGFLHCKKLHFLDLSSNRLSGELDDKLPVPCMTLFDISNNDMSGRIPAFYGSSCLQLPALKESLIEMDTPSSTYMSYFSYKAHVGILLPSSRGNEELMVYHNFGSNKFTGTIQSVPIVPFRLRRKAVYAFIAGNNRLTGPFPGNLFQSCNAFDGLIVNVSNNRISGQIPGDIASKCRNVIILDASGNQINGSLSDSFEKMTSLVALNLSSNLLEGEIPTSLGLLKGLKYLSLAYNDLTGSIPSSFRLLRSLEVLELFSNSLTGEIPKGLENLSNLSVLLLNNNNLFGQIPSGLANVTTLSAFNVSFNNLSGPWPLSGNFTGCDSVLGNPLYRYCHMLSPTLPTSEEHGSIEGAQSYTASPSESPTDGKGGLNPIEIASITSASAIFSVLMVLIVLFIYTRKCNPKSNILRSAKKEVIVFNDIGVQLTFENAVRATANFNASNCIGSGGFGTTYKAEISPGVLVAIKRLAVGRFQGVQQFHAEIKTLGRLHHPNLVTLIGYHASETEMFLIYNYLPGGNLEKFIKERSTRAVDWRVLHKIALDIARALAYLHDQCVPRVLHRDVKPSNILLDEDFNAYLSDFGLARLLGTSETHATTGVAGTVGYVAPEYAMTCRVSDKADVYSYGVVLLELLSDKKALDPSFSSYENGFNIVAWGCMLLRQGSAKEFFTAGLWDAGPHDDLVEILHLAVVCTVESLSTRPTMRQVVRRLKQLQPPSC